MFDITQNKGFHITFANGYTASVQWGQGNYCENRYGHDGASSATAECAAWDRSGSYLLKEESGADYGIFTYQSANDVLAFLNKVASL